VKEKPYPATPELNKLKAVHERSQACGEFLEWLNQEKKVVLAQFHRHTDGCYDMGLTPEQFRKEYAGKTKAGLFTATKSLCNDNELRNGRFSAPQCGLRQDELVTANYGVQKLLAEFFEIDMNKVEAERRAVLDYVREQNE